MTKSEFTDHLLHTRYREPMRKALELVFVEGMSQSEAGRQLNIPQQNVNRAVQTFKRKMK